MNSPSTSTASLLPRASKPSSANASTTQKDYSAAFANLQERYGFGGGAPILPNTYPNTHPSSASRSSTRVKKWLKWPTSNPSRATPSARTCPSPVLHENSLGTPVGPAPKDYESALRNLTDTYGGSGPVFGPGGW
ncbi:hypothetical protein M404DRAFT_1002837, partial [Pisolithus tinctorius Marx 270]